MGAERADDTLQTFRARAGPRQCGRAITTRSPPQSSGLLLWSEGDYRNGKQRELLLPKERYRKKNNGLRSEFSFWWCEAISLCRRRHRRRDPHCSSPATNDVDRKASHPSWRSSPTHASVSCSAAAMLSRHSVGTVPGRWVTCPVCYMLLHSLRPLAQFLSTALLLHTSARLLQYLALPHTKPPAPAQLSEVKHLTLGAACFRHPAFQLASFVASTTRSWH